MNEIENNTSYEDDEISLIDLFSVVIRYRMMIIIGTVLVFVLAVAYLFLFPLLNPKAKKSTVTVRYSVALTSVPTGITEELPAKYKDLKKIVNAEFNDLVFLVKEVKKNNPFSDGSEKELTEFQYNTYVQNLVKNKDFVMEPAVVRDEIIISMKIPEQQLPVATALVDSMVSSLNESVDAFFLKEVENLRKTKQETYDEMAKSYTGNSNIADAQTLLLTVRQINEFLADYSGFARREMEPFVVLEPLGRVKKTIIITFAAFFILVFIAFCKNAVENIKQDPEASEKIKAAWDGGKLGKK